MATLFFSTREETSEQKRERSESKCVKKKISESQVEYERNEKLRKKIWVNDDNIHCEIVIVLSIRNLTILIKGKCVLYRMINIKLHSRNTYHQSTIFNFCEFCASVYFMLMFFRTRNSIALRIRNKQKIAKLESCIFFFALKSSKI